MATRETESVRSPVRSEERRTRSDAVLLSSVEQPSNAESTRTQNISSQGARVMTQRIWQPGSLVTIRCARGSFWAEARVVYWRSFSNSRFAIGLKFLARSGDWKDESCEDHRLP